MRDVGSLNLLEDTVKGNFWVTLRFDVNALYWQELNPRKDWTIEYREFVRNDAGQTADLVRYTTKTAIFVRTCPP